MDKDKKKKILFRILVSVAELLIIMVALLTFKGEEFIGFNLDIRILICLIALYLIYPIYKFIVRVWDDIAKARKGN